MKLINKQADHNYLNRIRRIIDDASNERMLYKKSYSAGETVELGSIAGCGISAMYTVVIN